MYRQNNNLKLNKICRICALQLKDENIIPIFEETTDGSANKNSKKFVLESELKLLNIEISRNDGLPQVICRICFDILDNFHDFRILAQTSQITLRKQFHSSIKSSQSHVEETVNESVTHQALSDEDMKNTELQSDNTEGCGAIEDCQIDDNNKNNTEIGKLEKNGFCDNSIFDDDVGKPWKCWYCYESFATSNQLIDHEREHDEEKYYYCKRCYEPYKTPSDLRFHMNIHTATQQLCLCDFCGKTFANLPTLTSHRHRTHNSQYMRTKFSKEYKCPVCSQCFIIPQALEKHIKLHDRNRKHRCSECGVGYNRGDHLKRHINTAHIKEKLYDCEICGEEFLTDSSKSIHVRRHYIGNHKCDLCNKSFPYPYLLRSHERQLHNKYLTYHCKVCNKYFLNAGKLADHQQKHTKKELELANQKLLEDILKKHDIDL